MASLYNNTSIPFDMTAAALSSPLAGQAAYPQNRFTKLLPGAMPGMGGGMFNAIGGVYGGSGPLRWSYDGGWGYGRGTQNQNNDPFLPHLGMTESELQRRIEDARNRTAQFQEQRQQNFASQPRVMHLLPRVPRPQPRPSYTR